MTTAAPAIPALTAPATPRRPRVLLVGTALATSGVVMAFAGLIGTYLAVRHQVLVDTGKWLPKGTHIPLTPATMAMFTFALSAVTMQWAVYAVGNNDRQHAYFALGLTTLFGLATLNATSFLYSESNLGVRDSQAGALIYTITGAHMAMTVIGLVFAFVMTLRTLGGEYSGRDREGLTAAAMFWYATCVVYGAIWYAIYVTK